MKLIKIPQKKKKINEKKKKITYMLLQIIYYNLHKKILSTILYLLINL